MPALPVIQPSFAAGELSPFLYGRIDLGKFHVGARTMLNFFVHAHGGASNRPGTRFIGEVDDSTKRHRLIPFQFRALPAGQTYALVFGDMTMQVVMFNGTSWGFVLDGSGNIFTLATPYAAADLPLLKYVQSADTMTLTHPAYAPRNLTRTGHAAWTLSTIIFAPATPAPTGLSSNGASSITFVVTAINDTTGEESLPSAPATGTGAAVLTWNPVPGCSNYNVYGSNNNGGASVVGFMGHATTTTWTDSSIAPDLSNTPPQQRMPFGGSITAVTQANPGKVTVIGHGYQTGNVVAIAGVVGMTQLNGNSYAIAVVDANNFTIGVDTTGFGAYVSGGTATGPGNFPGCSTYFLQRQVYANTSNRPQTLWFSDVGAFNNMAVAVPTKDSDAITRTLVSRQVNEIRHMVPMTSMLIMTSGGEWRCYPGSTNAALTPAACVTLPQTFLGCSHVPPIAADNTVLFVQEKGSRVVALRFDALQDLYTSQDMSVLAQHVLWDTGAQYQIREWAWAQEPSRIVWAVRSDGVLLGFTYMREHEVYAWHRHTTDGIVESVCCISEGTEDAIYLIVNRTINGATKRYVERMVSRTFATVADAWFVDCGLQYVGAPVATISGLGYLEGKTVAILGDGSVVPSQVVTGGQITLDGSYSKVTVGLPYTSDLETLNLEVAGAGGTIQGEMKKIAQLTLRVKDGRGVAVGLNQTALTEVKQRTMETLGSAMQPFSGDWQVSIPSEWNRDGRLLVRQAYPLPCTILDLIPKVNVGD